MTGAVHFRQSGRVGGIVDDRPTGYTGLRAASEGRLLFGHCVPWRVPVTIPRSRGGPFVENFQPGSLTIIGGAAFTVGHLSEGGTRVGRVARIWDADAWADCALLVDEGPVGDAVLEGMGDDADRLPLSIGFRWFTGGGTITHTPPNGLPEKVRTRVHLTEIAIVKAGAYSGAHLYARGNWATLAQLSAGAM